MPNTFNRPHVDLLRFADPGPAELPDSAIQLPSRRAFVGAATAGAALLALGIRQADAQVAPNAPAPIATSPPGPARLIRLKAERRMVRLGTADQPESAIFRLAEAGVAAIDPLALPVIRAKSGESLGFEIENGLDQPVLLHARGARQANALDGMAPLNGTPILPGSKAAIGFSTRQAGTFFLAPSVAAHAPEQNARGLQAIVIVEEPEPPPVDHDIAFAVGDFRLGDNGMLAEGFGAKRDAARAGRLGNRLTTNGRPAPGRMSVRPGARLRLRLVNVSNARMIPLRVTNLVARVIAIDSTPCTPFDPLKRTVVLAPASRIDMMIDCPREAGVEGIVEAKIGDGVPIFAFRTEGALLAEKQPVTALPDAGLPPAIRLQDAMRVDFAITGGAPREIAPEDSAALDRLFPHASRLFQINGAPGTLDGKPLVSVKRGRVLVLALMNRTAWPQVLAVHGHAFRVLHAFDDGWEPYFLDTMYLNPGVTARIALIADNPGRWAIRSTIAEHYGAGVMSWFEVT